METSEWMGGDVGALVGALAKAVLDITGVSLDARNDAQNYRFASDEAILSVTRKALASHGLALVPVGIEVLACVPMPTTKGAPWIRTDILATYLLVHTGGGWLRVQSAGSGHDGGDKGIYKALTGALKYAARGALLLPVGLDPEVPTEAERPPAKPSKAQREAADTARRATHDPSWESARAAFAVACRDAGTSIDDVSAWCEAHGRPRPSQMDAARRTALVGWLRDHGIEVTEWAARAADAQRAGGEA